ncbi:unnamed protein product [Calypogeia fissa]
MNALVGTSQFCIPSTVCVAAAPCSCSSSSANAPESWRAPPSVGNRKNGLMTNLKTQLKKKNNNSHNSSTMLRVEAHNPQLDNLSGVVTDAAIPEGHKGLHGFLYGEGDADVHDSGLTTFKGKEGEDDGSSILGFDEYVSAREAGKFSGVYAVYNSTAQLEYVGYSRNVVLSLKTHRSRVGADKCASVRVKLYSKASIVSRAKLEEERQQWIELEDNVPPGNSVETDLWERSSGTVSLQLMTEEERSEYEEKKLKMRKAMGENLYDEVQGEEEGSRERRLKLLAATEGDDWSSVIDGQTKLTVQEKVGEPGVNGAQIESPFVQPNVPIVSPFDDSRGTRLYSADVYELNVENVDLVLNEVRPYLISDGGNVEVASVDDGVVSLRLQGACGTCPSSTVTMKMGIERVLNEKFGAALKGVVQVDQQQIGATIMGVNAHLEMLRPAIHNYGGFVDVVSVDSASGIAVVKFKGPAPIGMGIQAAIKDKFPDVKEVVLVDENRLVQV